MLTPGTDDLSAPFAASHLDTSHRSWPKCHRCSVRLETAPRWMQAAAGLTRAGWYPVEVYGLLGRERATMLNERYKLIIEASCHGEHEVTKLPIWRWYPEGKVVELVSNVVFFKRPGGIEMRTMAGLEAHGL